MIIVSCLSCFQSFLLLSEKHSNFAINIPILPYDSVYLLFISVRYTVSRATTCDQAFLSYWKEVQALLSVPERDISTVLLVFPEIDLFGNYEVFENYCDSLSDSLSSASLALEDEIQLVFFHPQYSFRDGHARAGVETGAANFARRSPWPMINLLRTPQVKYMYIYIYYTCMYIYSII